MTIKEVLYKALRREKTVLLIALGAATIAFIVMFGLGNIAHELGGRIVAIDFKTAAGWFARTLYAVFMFGTALNLLGLLIAYFRGTLEEK